MSQDDLERLEREEAELTAKLTEIRLAREEAKRKVEAEQPVILRVHAMSGNMIYVSNAPYRQDMLEIMKDISGRIWRSYEKQNGIPIGEWQEFIRRVTELPHISVTYDNGVEKQITEELFAPDFYCDIEARFFVVRASRRAYTYDLRQLPGHNYDYNRAIHSIPLSEGWRLFSFSEKSASFVWSDEAKEFVIKQVEGRLRLDEIAKAEDWDLPLIERLKITLRGFQKVGVAFFDNNGVRGILADEMGTGKTAQMIALCLMNKYKAVVICPASLKENWVREIRKVAQDASFYVLQGEIPSSYDIAHLIKERPDFVIINYDILGRNVEVKTDKVNDLGHVMKSSQKKFPWVEVINFLNPDIIIADEAHYFKNLDSNRSQGVRKLTATRFVSMTGTPVLNRPGELWPMLHMADPITFPAYETFMSQYTYDKKTVRNVDQLKELLKPLMIRRLKKDVIKELEPINRINDYYDLSVRAKGLYERILAGIYDVLSEWSPSMAGSQQKVTNMLVQIMRMKQVCAIDAMESTADLATRIYDASPEDGEEPNKVLIFSQFKPTTYGIGRLLGQEALSFVTMSPGREFVTADNHEQQKLIDRFQADPDIHFLCVTEKTAREGHNITAAKAVIFNDLFWTPAGHQQAEGRAYGRISDLHTIDSYYRIATGTISEWIMDLLAGKLHLIEQVVEGVEASRSDGSIVNELLAKMKEQMWTQKRKK